jgi:hypothetical protein
MQYCDRHAVGKSGTKYPLKNQELVKTGSVGDEALENDTHQI